MARNLPDLWRREMMDPFREISRLQRTMDRLFSDVLGEGGLPSLPQTQQQQVTTFMPACDVEETEKGYLLKMDLPGIKKEDIKIEFSENQLVVSGERKEEREEMKGEKGEKGSRYFYERSYGSFYRAFPLPTSVKPEQIAANYENGVLLIELPKTEVAQTRRIMIGEAKKAGQKAA